MKFKFKIQEYQTEAVDSVVKVFKGQPYSDGVSYRRDLGEVKPVLEPVQQQLSLFQSAQISLDDPVDDTGFLNEALQLTDDQLLHNIHWNTVARPWSRGPGHRNGDRYRQDLRVYQDYV